MLGFFRIALLAFGLIPAAVMATAQIPDAIRLDDEVSGLHSEPLNAMIFRLGTDWLKREDALGSCSANWRGYRAFWTIQDNKLLLERVVVDACAEKPREVSISTLFPGKSAPVAADWYTGVLTIPRGKQTQYVHMGYQSKYERYVILVVKKGLIVSRVDLDEPPQ